MIFSHVPITINRHEVIRYLGFKRHTSESSDDINALIEQQILEARYLLQPQGLIEHVQITDREQEQWKVICDHGKYVISGERIYKHLENCTIVTLMAVMVGQQLDEQIDCYFQQQQPTKGLILDAIGSDSVERVADYVNEYVNKEAKRKGYTTRFRFSPGYGGWSVEHQRPLIEYLQAERIGVTITEYSQLVPRKSVSAVIGWQEILSDQSLSDSAHAEHDLNGERLIKNKCSSCETDDCQFKEDKEEEN